jgi:hypothetical protein
LNYFENEITDADRAITSDFYKSFQLSIVTDLMKSDLLMDDSFKAENINSKLFINFQEVDNHINKRFYSSN